jgi:putative SOS response-associated peptidase YedK
MCGRFVTRSDELSWQQYVDLLDIARVQQGALDNREMVAPTDVAAVVRCCPQSGEREIMEMRWGLAPPWPPGVRGAPRFNVRSESAEKAYNISFLQTRCVVPVSGFFEYQKVSGRKSKKRWLVEAKDQPLMSLAGLWKASPNGVIEAFTILTTRPNALIKPLHHRMPVVLGSEDAKRWLSPEAAPETLAVLFDPIDSDLLAVAEA